MADRYWIATTTQSWNDTANWSTTATGVGGSSVPSTSDNAFFTASRLGSCTVNANVTVIALSLAAGYTGTFDCATNNPTVTLTGNFTAASTRVDMGSGNWNVAGNFNNASVTTWNKNTAQLTLSGTTKTFTPVFTNPFYKVVISGTYTNNAGVWAINTLIVSGTFTDNPGAPFIYTDLQVTGTFNGTSVVVLQSGCGISVMSGHISGSYLVFYGDHDNNIVPATYESALVYFEGRASTTAIVLSAGTYNFTGTVIVDFDGPTGSWTFDLSQYNPTINITGGYTSESHTGTVTVKGSSNNITVNGLVDMHLWDTYTRGSGTFILGGTTGSVDINFFDKTIEALQINASGATKRLTDGFTAASLTHTAGTFNPNGQTFITDGDFTIVDGALTTAAGFNSSNITVNGKSSFSGHAGALLNLKATAAWTITDTHNYNLANYVDVAFSNAGGGNRFYARNSTNDGTNTNWFWRRRNILTSST
jgi:hypothetical protein